MIVFDSLHLHGMDIVHGYGHVMMSHLNWDQKEKCVIVLEIDVILKIQNKFVLRPMECGLHIHFRFGGSRV